MPCRWPVDSHLSCGLVRERTAVKYAAIADWAADKQYPVTFMCAQLGVARQGYYRWLSHGPEPARAHRRRAHRADPGDPPPAAR